MYSQYVSKHSMHTHIKKLHKDPRVMGKKSEQKTEGVTKDGIKRPLKQRKTCLTSLRNRKCKLKLRRVAMSIIFLPTK